MGQSKIPHHSKYSVIQSTAKNLAANTKLLVIPAKADKPLGSAKLIHMQSYI